MTRHPHPPESTAINGIVVTSVAEAVLAAARFLSLLDLVVLVDSALHLGRCTRGDLEAVATLRRRGAPALRRVLRYADQRSESAWETLLRMLHVACGITAPARVRPATCAATVASPTSAWCAGATSRGRCSTSVT
ncbi:hypothetical protein [Nocardioides sp.]|uniref:hypothetical protein n=1 Tax=Nocardioides sp. TaxID=35761 RepID=UPI0039E4B904